MCRMCPYISGYQSFMDQSKILEIFLDLVLIQEQAVDAVEFLPNAAKPNACVECYLTIVMAVDIVYDNDTIGPR